MIVLQLLSEVINQADAVGDGEEDDKAFIIQPIVAIMPAYDFITE